MTPIPEAELAVAMHLGLRDDEARTSWANYVTWYVGRQGERALLGGASWTRWATQDAANIAKRADQREDAAGSEARARAHRAATCCTFAMHLAALDRREAQHGPDAISAYDLRVLAWYRGLSPERRRSPGLSVLDYMAHAARQAPEPALSEPLAHEPSESEWESRRQQSIRDAGEFAAGLGLDGEPDASQSDVPLHAAPLHEALP